MPQKSRFSVVVENLSSVTRSKDIRYECERYGKVLCVERDARARMALVEFDRSRDAERAWEQLDGIRVDGCRWRVDWATRQDFDFFQWSWREGPSRSPSPSPSRFPSPASPHSRSRGGSRDEKADLQP